MRTISRSFKLWICFLVLAVLGTANAAFAKQFEVFDGHVYNGKYYPQINVVEGTYPDRPSDMQFQVWWKGHTVDMSFELTDNEKGDKVMLVHYFIPERNEHLCRRVLAPGHFAKGFSVYRETSDKDIDNTIVTMTTLPERSLASGGTKKLTPVKYVPCPEDEEDAPAAKSSRAPSADEAAVDEAGEAKDQVRTKNDKAAIRKKSSAVPFSDW